MKRIMKLKEFIDFFIDEEVRIEFEIEVDDKEDYEYDSWWLSDYRDNPIYEDFKVICFSLEANFDNKANISIRIKP